jgi:hypothetical protein
MITHAMVVAVQNKARSYIERMLDDFIPFVIETYNCLHPHFDSFLTSYVHAYIVRHHIPSWYLQCLYLIIGNECQ